MSGNAFALVEAINSLADGDEQIVNAVDFSLKSATEITVEMNYIIDALSGSSEAVSDDHMFDTIQSMLKHIPAMGGPTAGKLLLSLQAAMLEEVEATMQETEPAGFRAHKPTLERLAWLLARFVVEAERGNSEGPNSPAVTKKRAGAKGAAKGAAKKKAAKGDEYIWSDAAGGLLQAMVKALRLKSERVWQATSERNAFVTCFTKSANLIAESPVHMKTATVRDGVIKVLASAVLHHEQDENVQSTILQKHLFYEHLAAPMAELLAFLAVEPQNHPSTADGILRQIAAKTFSSAADSVRDSRVFASFVSAFALKAPRVVEKQIITLQKLLDSDAYPIRIAMIETLGALIDMIAASKEDVKRADGFFDLLFERFLDTNAFVRASCVRTFKKLLDIKTVKFPPQRLRLAKEAARSLNDKTSNVRKCCIEVLDALIDSHPYGAMYGGDLSHAEWTKRKAQVDEEFAQLTAAIADAAAAQPAVEVAPAPDAAAASDVKMEETDPAEALAAPIPPTSDTEMADGDAQQATGDAEYNDEAMSKTAEQLAQAQDARTLELLSAKVRYHVDAITFIETLHSSLPMISTLLASKTKSEVIVSMDFYCQALKYGLEGAEDGMKRMLHLVWVKDNSSISDEPGEKVKSISKHVLECYRDTYFLPLEATSDKDNVNRIARNLLERTYGASLAELVSLEEVLTRLVADDVIGDDVVSKLWQLYGTDQHIQRQQRRGAIVILGMLAAAKRSIVAERVDLLLQIGLGPHGRSDFVLAKHTCIALRRLGGSEKKVKGSLQDKTQRLPMANEIFDRLRTTLETPTRDKEWFGLAEQAIDTIYALGDQPDALCTSILRNMANRVFRQPLEASRAQSRPMTPRPATPSVHGGENGDQDMQDENVSPARSQTRDMSTQAAEPQQPGSAFDLAQVLFAAGHCAIKQLIHLEVVEREMKRLKSERDKAQAATSERGKDADELDQVAGSVEDNIADEVLHIKEYELLYSPQSLLAVFGPIAAEVAGNTRYWKSPTLQNAAVLALCKFMCVSSRFCEDHLELLFELLDKSAEPTVRSNLVIALGDIAVSFSTLMDAKSDELYFGLSDPDLTVQKHTLMVLTHLILNGMIKVKGKMGEMAKCLDSVHARIGDLTKLFFTELANKDNAIYNNLPDIISHLSTGEHAVSEEMFETTMNFIFEHIEKEKQAALLIEKLCARFKMVEEPQQWRNFAFCLSQLPYKSEASVKKLVEGLTHYQDKLKEPKVYSRFTEILDKIKKNKAAKNEDDLKAFEEMLATAAERGKEEDGIERRAEAKKKKRAARAPPAKKRAKRAVQSESESD